MKYIGYKCPVCERIFTEEDNVVVCPECGTPHHRECYFKEGRCHNEYKHGTNEPIEVEFTEVEESEKQEPEKEKEDEFNFKSQEQEAVKEIFEQINGDAQNIYLNGKHISFYEAAIGKNQKFYIPRFMLIDKTKKAISWNVAGFFVPFAWCIYRKMYKFALIIMALYMLMFGAVTLTVLGNEEITQAVEVCMAEDPAFSEKILLYSTNSADATLTENQMKLYTLTSEYKLPTPIVILTYVITYGVRIVMGIYATNLYYKKITASIQKTEAMALSDDMKRSYLFRKCGTLPFILAAIIGFFEWQMF